MPVSRDLQISLELTKLLHAVGTESFGRHFYNWISTLIPVDYITLALHGEDYRPLKRFVTLDQQQQTIAFQYDLNRLFTQDPNRDISEKMQRRQQEGPIVNRTTFAHLQNTDYGKLVHTNLQLCDRLSIISIRKSIRMVINLYRKNESGVFAENIQETLENIAPLANTIGYLHIDRIHLRLLTSNNPHWIEEALHRSQFKLSPREFQIAARTLAGQEVGQMIDDLKLSINTVKTMKRRIYEKLKVNSVLELHKLALGWLNRDEKKGSEEP